jgi:hypothetical protein
MEAKFRRFAAISGRARRASAGLLLSLFAAGAAQAAGTPEQRRACTPDVYRLCPGEIPNVRAITACLRRQKASLSEACRVAFEQADH